MSIVYVHRSFYLFIYHKYFICISIYLKIKYFPNRKYNQTSNKKIDKIFDIINIFIKSFII